MVFKCKGGLKNIKDKNWCRLGAPRCGVSVTLKARYRIKTKTMKDLPGSTAARCKSQNERNERIHSSQRNHHHLNTLVLSRQVCTNRQKVTAKGLVVSADWAKGWCHHIWLGIQIPRQGPIVRRFWHKLTTLLDRVPRPTAKLDNQHP